MRAVLVDAIGCLVGRGVQANHRAKVAMQARAWVARRGRDFLFSFDTICDVLDLDGERLRGMLLAESARSRERTLDLLRSSFASFRARRPSGARRKAARAGADPSTPGSPDGPRSASEREGRPDLAVDEGAASRPPLRTALGGW